MHDRCGSFLTASYGLDRFILRGKKKVNIQWNLFCIVHNLKKGAPPLGSPLGSGPPWGQVPLGVRLDLLLFPCI
ncbi:MAG: transposase [Desulfurivibrionaceae bacterium]